MSYTKTRAEKDGWTFFDGPPERHDGGWADEIVLPTYAASKLVGTAQHVKEHPSEDQLLADIEQWEARQDNPPTGFVEPLEAPVDPLPDPTARPAEYRREIARRVKAQNKELEGTGAYVVPDHVGPDYELSNTVQVPKAKLAKRAKAEKAARKDRSPRVHSGLTPDPLTTPKKRKPAKKKPAAKKTTKPALTVKKDPVAKKEHDIVPAEKKSAWRFTR